MLRFFFLWFYKVRKHRASKAFLRKTLASINRGDAARFTGNSNSFKEATFGKYDIPGHLKNWSATALSCMLVILIVWFIWESLLGLSLFQ